MQTRSGTDGAQQPASAAHNLPEVHDGRLLHSKGTGTVAGSRIQDVAGAAGQHQLEGMNDDTAGSPDLQQQVGTVHRHMSYTYWLRHS